MSDPPGTESNSMRLLNAPSLSAPVMGSWPAGGQTVLHTDRDEVRPL